MDPSSLQDNIKSIFWDADLPEKLGTLAPGLGENPANRIGEIRSTNERIVLDFISDGLSLNDKTRIEIYLKDCLRSSGNGSVADQLTLNFLRKKSNSGGPQGANPRPLESARGPFGLKFQKRAIPNVKRIIAVASGKGGVGKSTVATNLAAGLSGRHGWKVGLFDADFYGPSAPLMFGAGVRVPQVVGDLLEPPVLHGVKVMSFGFLSDARSPVIWRGPMVARAFEQFAHQTNWGELDCLVIDLPPGTGDVQLSMAEKLPIAGAVIVSTPQDIALIDAQKAVSMFKRLDVPILGVIENMAVHECSNCGHRDHIFGEGGAIAMAKEREIPFLGQLPLRADIRFKGDSGNPPILFDHGPWAEAFGAVVAKIWQAQQ